MWYNFMLLKLSLLIQFSVEIFSFLNQMIRLLLIFECLGKKKIFFLFLSFFKLSVKVLIFGFDCVIYLVILYENFVTFRFKTLLFRSFIWSMLFCSFSAPHLKTVSQLLSNMETSQLRSAFPPCQGEQAPKDSNSEENCWCNSFAGFAPDKNHPLIFFKYVVLHERNYTIVKDLKAIPRNVIFLFGISCPLYRTWCAALHS